MNHPSLVLCPEDPHWIPPDDKRLSGVLRSLHFIGNSLNGADDYLAGDRFLDMVAFLGCSPHITLEPDQDQHSFCYIHISQAVAIELHQGRHSHAPRCPACSEPVDDWQIRLAIGSGDGTQRWSCVACRFQGAPWEFNWRKSAGFGRCFIEIRNIYPKEAIPQSRLLDTLHSHYGTEWQYFYQY